MSYEVDSLAVGKGGSRGVSIAIGIANPCGTRADPEADTLALARRTEAPRRRKAAINRHVFALYPPPPRLPPPLKLWRTRRRAGDLIPDEIAVVEGATKT